MKVLPVKFSESQAFDIKQLAEDIGTDVSKLSRAALRLGVMQINTLAGKDIDKAIDLVIVNDARSK